MSRSPRTVRAYRSDWDDFTAWCSARDLRAMPATPAVVASYLDDLGSRRRASTVQRRVAAIRARHLDAGRPTPTDDHEVRAAVTRVQWRTRDETVVTEPIGVAELRGMSMACPPTIAGARDRAVLLVGYGAGLRPGEITALDAADVVLAPAGLRVRVAHGQVVVPFGSDEHLCAVRAWKAWRRLGGAGPGPAFRAVDRTGRVSQRRLSEKAITRIVRRAAERAGLDGARWSGLSLRRGMVSAATEHGVGDRNIMQHTGHRSRRLVRRYMRDSVRPRRDAR